MPSRKRGKCIICNKIKPIAAKKMCKYCYGRNGSPIVECKRCGEKKHHHAKGLCSNCYNRTFNYENIKYLNYTKDHNISAELYKELTKGSCMVCKFDKAIDLHHLDGSKKNNSKDNFVRLCPNHHRLIHNELHSRKVLLALKRKGIINSIKNPKNQRYI